MQAKVSILATILDRGGDGGGVAQRKIMGMQASLSLFPPRVDSVYDGEFVVRETR